MRILVTGGTGFLGAHLARALLAGKHYVVISGRNFAQAQPLIEAGAIPIRADLADSEATIDSCRGVDAVCHVGALSSPWGRREEFFAANVSGTAAVIEGCRRHNVRRLVHVSSPSVLFDGRDHLNLTEAAPYPHRFVSEYSRTKKLAEDLVNAATGVPAVILRPKAIFGPGDRALLPRLVAAARAGRLPQIGNGQNRVDLTYVDNVVRAILLALDSDAAVGKTYTITNDEHPLLWKVIRTVLMRLGIAPNLCRVPLSLALAAAAVMEWRAAFTHREPLLTRYAVGILARTQTYDISAAKRDLGYGPQITVAEGIERTLLYCQRPPISLF